MILIWDNGGSYSDHTIYFVECGELSVDDVVSFAKLRGHDDGFELARTEALDWRDTESGLSTPCALAPDLTAVDLSSITTPALKYLLATRVNVWPEDSEAHHLVAPRIAKMVERLRGEISRRGEV